MYLKLELLVIDWEVFFFCVFFIEKLFLVFVMSCILVWKYGYDILVLVKIILVNKFVKLKLIYINWIFFILIYYRKREYISGVE